MAHSAALERCNAQGESWKVWDLQTSIDLYYAPKNQCDHYAYAWKETKTQEQEDAEDMGWDVPNFLTTYLDALRSDSDVKKTGKRDFWSGKVIEKPTNNVEKEPRITESFITYIYGKACCAELRDARTNMHELWEEKEEKEDLMDWEEE